MPEKAGEATAPTARCRKWRRGNSMLFPFLKCGATGRSFPLDVGGLDDRPPLLDLSFLFRGKCVLRLLLRWWEVLALIGKSLAHCCVGQGSLHRRIKLYDYFFRRSFRHPEPVPERSIKPRDPCFINGRDIRRRRPSGLGHDGIGFEIAIAYMHEGAGRLAKTEVNL